MRDEGDGDGGVEEGDEEQRQQHAEGEVHQEEHSRHPLIRLRATHPLLRPVIVRHLHADVSK